MLGSQTCKPQFKRKVIVLIKDVMKCFGISGTEMPNFDWENKDTVMAFYVTAEMKSVASWLCARHEVLGK